MTIVGAVALMATLQACQESTAEQAPGDTLRTARVETITAGPAYAERRFVGRVAASSTVDLSFQVGGRIVNMPVQEGSIVPAGNLIAELDKTDYERAVREAQVALELSELDHQRNQQMLNNGAIPQATYDRALADLEMRRLALAAAERNLSYASIEVPFDALVTRRLVDSFTQVQAGTEVVRVQDVTELRVNISVPENLMSVLQTPERFSVVAQLSAYPGQSFELEYREHATEADPVTQTYPISFALDRSEAPGALPGMTATVIVTSRQGAMPDLITVPVAALDTAADGSFRLWVYDQQTAQVSPRTVTVGTLGSERVEIESGVQIGEQIVTAGAHLLRDGMRVTPYVSVR
tara:strand:- start:93 stop:1145 length:1053 start_codon:yes stop_codon:yes gene_type:complete